MTRIGVDIGGTFTDVAAVDTEGKLHIGKRLTTHEAEHQGVLEAVGDTDLAPLDPATIVAHGTTLVINSLIERKGARVGLVTTAGFADVLELGRASRPEIFNLFYRRDPHLVPAARRFEVNERVYASGEIARRPTREELEALAEELRRAKVESIGIAFLNSYIQPENERVVADSLRQALPSVPVAVSSDLSREWREYERASTVVANAYVAPIADRYVHRLLDGLKERGFAGEFIVLDSNGGALHVEAARRFPVRLVESGPVAGVVGARDLADRLSIANVVTFDMGGTTAKTCLIENGRYASVNTYYIGGYERGFPLQVHTVDVTEVGAGGGSIAWVDEAGRLRVGPRSAGPRPGPACYGLGGVEPTVTDANLYCGRIDKDRFVGSLRLDDVAAAAAIERLAATVEMPTHSLALGIIKLVNLSMAAAVRLQSLARGRDPREFTLAAYGGAGPMHACEVAGEVGIRQVLIPVCPGHYSAIGMLGANLRLDRFEVLQHRLSRLDVGTLRETLGRITAELESELSAGMRERKRETKFTYSLALRYVGQDHTLLVPNPGSGTTVPDNAAEIFRRAFEEEYARRYGHLGAAQIEVIEVEVVAESILPKAPAVDLPASVGETGTIESYFDLSGEPVTTIVVPRGTLAVGETFEGPLIIYEEGATSVIPPGVTGTVTEDSSLLLDVAGLVDQR